MARATKTSCVINSADIELMLDKLAFVMSRAKDASVYLPLWKRLEHELSMRQDVEQVLAAANARVRQSRHRTEARS